MTNSNKIKQMDKMQFVCKLETVARKEVLISLFQSSGNQVKDGANDEFLMHLDAEVLDQGNEKVQEAEFIIIVDRFMQLFLLPFSSLRSILPSQTNIVYQEWINARHSLETGSRSTL